MTEVQSGIVFWSDLYLEFDFGEGHVYRSDKYRQFYDLVTEHKDNYNYMIEEVDEGIAVEDIQSQVHTSHYDRLVQLSTTGEGYIDQGSTPAIKGLLEIIRYYCQATYLGIKYLLDDIYNYSFNCLGGRHHAGPNKSGGSSYINDLGVAIPKLRRGGYDEKIAIIDLDYHPHDGTLMHFGDDPTVFTTSIHDEGWGSDPQNIGWGSGMGTSYEIDVTEQISGEEYIELLEEKVIPKVIEFGPSLIVYINGVDGHKDDAVSAQYPVRNFALDNNHYHQCARILAEFAADYCEKKIIGLGAGGYTAEPTANVWFDTISTFDTVLGSS